jgi:hypothetical protein
MTVAAATRCLPELPCMGSLLLLGPVDPHHQQAHTWPRQAHTRAARRGLAGRLRSREEAAGAVFGGEKAACLDLHGMIVVCRSSCPHWQGRSPCVIRVHVRWQSRAVKAESAHCAGQSNLDMRQRRLGTV